MYEGKKRSTLEKGKSSNSTRRIIAMFVAICCALLAGSVLFVEQAMACSIGKADILPERPEQRFVAYVLEDILEDDGDEEVTQTVTETVSDFTAVLQKSTQVKLKWTVENKSESDITRFEIYRSEVAGEQGQLIDIVYNSCDLYEEEYYDEFYGWTDYRDTDYASYIDEDVKIGTTYYYTIRAGIFEYGTGSYGPFCDTVAIYVTLEAPTVSVKGVDEHTVAVAFKEVTGTECYQIERAMADSDEFTLISEISSDKTLSYNDTSVVLGSNYSYRVRAYCTVDGERIYGEYSSVHKITPTLRAPVIKKAKIKNPTTLVISFSKVNKAQGYCLYKRNTKTGKYKRIKTVKGNANTKFTIKKLKNGTTYSYKIAGYTTVYGKRLYGTMSKKKSKTMNYYAYEMEPWENRYKRIFGNSEKYWYSSAKEASKHMKTIKIKVWDISNGKKVTRIKYLTVHKKIAPTVKKIFSELYKSKEKFPIHDIGGYNWRGDSSTSLHCIGLAIDINANENYMVQDGKALVGSFWKPKKNPYSIPKDGALVKIMAKYGFSWGGEWGGKKDYMHFSYFGG